MKIKEKKKEKVTEPDSRLIMKKFFFFFASVYPDDDLCLIFQLTMESTSMLYVKGTTQKTSRECSTPMTM